MKLSNKVAISPTTAYRALKDELGNPWNNIIVIDLEKFGFVLPHMECDCYIYIAPGFTPLEKFFVLVHEMGHIFTYPTKKHPYGRRSKNHRNEDQANEYVLRVCRIFLGRGLGKRYSTFYNKIKKRTEKLKAQAR